MYDAIIIGGGFYGVAIASYLKAQRKFERILLIEAEKELLTRASFSNQARVHNGYHYPRSYTTAFRSRINLPRFVQDYSSAVKTDFTKLYAIARNGSKVTAKQFERFCREIGARLESPPKAVRELFQPRLIEAVYLVEEYAFDASKLRDIALESLKAHQVEIRLNTRAHAARKSNNGNHLIVESRTGFEGLTTLSTKFIFNCTYSGLNQIGGDFPGTTAQLKHEIAEMALMRMPDSLRNLGVTIMDGPFFSRMPFPTRGLHTLSHVRYTPHAHWHDQRGIDPYHKIKDYPRETRVERMIRDVARYVPAVLEAQYVDSLFEAKTVLQKNENDDGRPILFEHHQALPNCYSILGGKIDNIYDVLEKLDAENLPPYN